MDSTTIMWIGIVIGCAGGVAGGVIGTRRALAQATTPAAKKRIVRLSVFCWFGIWSFIGLMLVLPPPYGLLLLIVYGIALPLVIRYINQRVAEGSAD
ncbi:MAG: hypothetical protein OTI37_05575, partial [Planctomycetota bacterium]|nr:hypothetical protein [Planctomycetota bacterium]